MTQIPELIRAGYCLAAGSAFAWDRTVAVSVGAGKLANPIDGVPA